jgi:trimethylamine--corrinoid protein Co-methyltransferase
MAAIVTGGEDHLREKPFIFHYVEPTSPLLHSSQAVERLFLCADKGIPIIYTPGMLSGATGPVTLAGAITVANAESLSGIVLHQLRSKGAPIISGALVTTMDMLTSTIVYGAPELRLTHSALADLYHYYEIPIWGTAGCSDANALDEQAAMETAMSILMAALDGANLIHDGGYLGHGLICCPAMIVMCSEIISYVKRIISGFDIGADKIDIDVIRRVGPGGHFLSEDQTVRLLRNEHWRPKFMNRDDIETWTQTGMKSYHTKVTQKAIEIIETHKPERLPDGIGRVLDEIAKNAEMTLAKEAKGNITEP